MEPVYVTRLCCRKPSCFVPELLEHLYNCQGHKDGPYRHRLKGALLYIDVCNFTAMTEAASRQGHYGVELITGLLNGYYTAVDKIVKANGGEIIKFAGDAFLAVFLGDKAAAGRAVANVVNQLQHKLVKLNQKVHRDYNSRLAFHGISGWGQFDLIVMGDPQWHQDYILYGDTLRKLFAIALPGTDNQVMGMKSQEGTQLLKIRLRSYANEKQEALLSFLPPPVRDTIVFRHFRAELRNVAILFIHLDVRGIPGGSYLKQLNRAYIHIQQCVYRYEGIVNKLDFNEKGLVVLCSFGIPVAHLNDIERAIIAARAVLDYPQKSVFRIGCTYNNVYAGILGSPVRYEYGIIGSGVNAAARLMQEAAVDQILITGSMLQTVGVRFQCEYLKDTTVKGFLDPISIYQIKSELPVSYHSLSRLFAEQRMVAWQDELSRVEDGLINGDQPFRLYVKGEPGVGKTFLIWNLLNHLHQKDRQVAMISLDEYNQAETYYLIHTILTQHFHLDKGPYSESQLCSLVNNLDSELNYGLLCGYFNATPVRYHTDSDRDIHQEVIFEQVQRLFELMLRSIDILVVDNIHWLDRMSLRLLSSVSPACPVHIILTARYGMHAQLFSEYQGLELLNLEPETARRLVTGHLGMISDEALEYLFKLTQGNPLFLIELCREINLAYKQKTRLITLADLISLERKGSLPHSIENVFVNRLAVFNPETQYVLKLAAIIGKAFTPDEINVIDTHNIREKVLELLLDLDHNNLISRIDITPDVLYMFSNNLMREAIYNTILLSEKRGLHNKIAAHYEELLGPDKGENLEIIANHYILAENPEKATEFCVRAADKNYALGNYEESSFYYSSALRFTSDDNKKEEIQLALIDSLFYHAELETAVNQLESLKKPAPEDDIYTQYTYLKAKALYLKGDFIQLADFVSARMNQLEVSHYYYLSLIFYADALRSISRLPELTTIISMLNTSINLQLKYCSVVQLRYSDKTFPQLLQSARDANPGPGLAEILYYIGKLESIKGQLCFDQSDYRGSEIHYQRVMEVAELLKDDIAVRVALNSLGNINRRRGHPKAAMRYYKKAKNLAEKCGDRYGYLKVLQDMAIMYRQQGDLDLALHEYQTSLEMASIMGNRSQEENALYNIGELHFHNGQLDEAENYIKKALDLAIDISDSLGISFANDALGDIALQKGSIDDAERHYKDNLRFQENIKDMEGMAHTYGNLGNVARLREDYQQALQLYQKNLGLCQEIEDASGEGCALLNIGLTYLSIDQIDQAMTYLIRAKKCFKDAGVNDHNELIESKLLECGKSVQSFPAQP